MYFLKGRGLNWCQKMAVSECKVPKGRFLTGQVSNLSFLSYRCFKTILSVGIFLVAIKRFCSLQVSSLVNTHKATSYRKLFCLFLQKRQGGTFPLPPRSPTDEEIELLSHCFQPEKRMPAVIKNNTGRKPRKKSAHERAVDNKTKIDQSRRRRAISACKARPNQKKLFLFYE